jgi:cysteine desulfurase/selenocysteine lyase
MVLDGAQSVPHIKTDFKDLDVDFITFSAHKMCGPTGVGCLIGKASLLEKMDNFHLGGGMNVKFFNDSTYISLEAPAKFEAGTLNVAGIIGFKAAIEFINSIGIENIEEHEKELFDYAISRLESIKDIVIYNKDSNSGIISFNREGVFPQDEATLLNSKGIAVRSGQHCAKMIDNVIHTVATVRASFYLYTSKEEVDVLINELEKGGDILDAYFK